MSKNWYNWLRRNTPNEGTDNLRHQIIESDIRYSKVLEMAEVKYPIRILDFFTERIEI